MHGQEIDNASPTGVCNGSGGHRFIHFYRHAPLEGELWAATWNVEGLSQIKLFELVYFMKRQRIGILCLQETHIPFTPYYNTDDGFLVILLGSSAGGRESAGVGFIIAPWLRKAVVGFLQQSNRLACLKLRVPHGQISIITAYAPHSGWAFDSRQAFFEDLGVMFTKTSVNGARFVFGDFNARIGHRIPGEEAFIGDYTFGNHRVHGELGSNRSLLIS